MFIPSREPPVVIHDQYVGLLTALYDVFGAGRPIAAKLVKAAARKSQLLWFALDGRVDDSTYISNKLRELKGRATGGYALKRTRRFRIHIRTQPFGFLKRLNDRKELTRKLSWDFPFNRDRSAPFADDP
jgi:hypothetical protein